jgi:Mn2+/Fe2+ NRAMP family transporter
VITLGLLTVQARGFRPMEILTGPCVLFIAGCYITELALAGLVNAVMLLPAAAAFHFSGQQEVASIRTAYVALDNTLRSLAKTAFGFAAEFLRNPPCAGLELPFLPKDTTR